MKIKQSSVGFLPKRGTMSVYLQGYANLFNKMHRPSIPPHTVLCTHVIFSGIPKHSHNSGRCFFANLSSVLHSTSLYSSTLNLGNFQYGKICFDEYASYRRTNSSSSITSKKLAVNKASRTELKPPLAILYDMGSHQGVAIQRQLHKFHKNTFNGLNSTEIKIKLPSQILFKSK